MEMVNLKIKKRLIDSLDYLRGMDFFQEYSDLASEEILERIFNGEINYPCSWCCEEPGVFSKKPEPILHGPLLLGSIEDRQKYWMKKSDFEIDRSLIPFDTKRVIVEDAETSIDDNIGMVLLKRLARISRGVFQPTNISWRWLTPKRSKWLVQEVSFDFKGERHSIEIVLQYDYIQDMGLEELNELIEKTGYQYYRVKDEYIIIVVLTKDEVKRLEDERGWKLYSPLPL